MVVQINYPEAESVVSLMIACMEQPEYERKTFGITLLRGDQTKLIQKLFSKGLTNVIERANPLR